MRRPFHNAERKNIFCYMKNAAVILNLENALFNLNLVRERAADADLYAVVKADAYGHGTTGFARFLSDNGVKRFVAGSLDEGKRLRESGITGEILVLGATPPESAEELCYLKLSQSVFCAEYARELALAARLNGIKLKVHVKVDTGMNRLGFPWFAPEQIAASCPTEFFETSGVFTHFGSADGRDAQSEMRTRIQGERFINCLDGLDKIGFERGVAHCCNSRALFRYPQYRLDAVRVGAALYGIGGADRALKPVLSMRAPLLQVRFADKGEYIGYGLRKLERPAKLGIVGAGYGHGISRRLSDKGSVLVNGQKCPVVGRICMDFLTVDLTGAEAETGDDTATTNKYLQKAVDVFDERYAPSEQQVTAAQPSEKSFAAISDENEESHGDQFLQNVARLMDEYGVSTLDELMEAMDDDHPKPRRTKDFEM